MAALDHDGVVLHPAEQGPVGLDRALPYSSSWSMTTAGCGEEVSASAVWKLPSSRPMARSSRRTDRE
jgi:hypothetical protein